MSLSWATSHSILATCCVTCHTKLQVPAAGTSGVEALVAAMHAKEDSNFRLFGYVGDINSEAEKLQAHADDVQKELDRYQAAADAQDAERQSKLQVAHNSPTPFFCDEAHAPQLHAWSAMAGECVLGP